MWSKKLEATEEDIDAFNHSSRDVEVLNHT